MTATEVRVSASPIIHNVEEHDELKWGVVQSVGPEVLGLKPGNVVLYDTRHIVTKKFDDVEIIVCGDYAIVAVNQDQPVIGAQA